MNLKRLALVPGLLMSLLVAAPTPVSAAPNPVAPAPVASAVAQEFRSACPEMTDSIYRLYVAFFQREPEQGGWEYWMTTYGQTDANLETISTAFVDSQEFRNRYGSLNNQEFVELVYANVMNRIPDDAGLAHWRNALDNGLDRGELMIAFSESAEFVNLTRTMAPLAGYLQWYKTGVRFFCGVGNVNLLVEGDYADVHVWNGSENEHQASVAISTPAGELDRSDFSLPVGYYNFIWNMPLADNNVSSIQIAVDNSNLTFWTVVYYPHPHAEDRNPYSG